MACSLTCVGTRELYYLDVLLCVYILLLLHYHVRPWQHDTHLYQNRVHGAVFATIQSLHHVLLVNILSCRHPNTILHLQYYLL